MKTPRKVIALVLPELHLLDLAGPVQVFFEATEVGTDPYTLHYVGADREEVSAQGLAFTGLQAYDELELGPRDIILVPGVDFQYYSQNELIPALKDLMQWVKAQHEKGVLVSSICSGALVLAKAGMLDHYKCTSHWKCIDYLRDQFPKVKVLADQIFVEDRGIMTSAGMTSGIDMALSMIEHFSGPITTAKVAQEMVVYIRRHGGERQASLYLDYRTHFNPTVHKVQHHLVNNISRNPSLQALAELFNTSERNLTRLFKKHVGLTIQEYKDVIRLELASHLLNNPEFTQEYIAEKCGFQDSRQFRRLWKRKHGYPPSDYALVNAI